MEKYKVVWDDGKPQEKELDNTKEVKELLKRIVTQEKDNKDFQKLKELINQI